MKKERVEKLLKRCKENGDEKGAEHYQGILDALNPEKETVCFAAKTKKGKK